MKEYTPEKLVTISRYQNYFPSLPKDIQSDVYARMEELISEEKEYCDRGNYGHMAQILTSIALYDVLQKHGRSEEEAYRIVSEEMWKFLDPSVMQKLARKKFFLPLMKKIVPFGFKKGSGYGWRYTWHTDDPKDRFHFECNECIYPILHADMFDTMVKYYNPNGNLPQYILGKADEDDYTGFPKIIMYFAGDEVFSGIAPDYEKSFIRCGVKDYTIKIKPGMPHAWPVFTFLKEGRDGEIEIIGDIRAFYTRKAEEPT